MRVNPTLRYGSILLLAVILLSLIPAGVVTALSIGSVKPAQASSLTVTPTKIWKNVLKVVVNAPGDEPPTVAVKVGGEVKYYILLGYAGGNKWVGFIALREARNVSFEAHDLYKVESDDWNNPSATNYVNVSGAVTSITGYTPEVYFNVTKGLASPGVIYNKLAFVGTSNVNVTLNNKKYCVGENVSQVWPFINVLDVNTLDIDVGDSLTIEFGSEAIDVTYGPTEVSVGSPDRTTIPPEAVVTIPLTDETYFTDPTKAGSSYNSLKFTNKSVVLTVSASREDQNMTTIFNLSKVYGAIRAAFSDAGKSDFTVNATLIFDNGDVKLKLNTTTPLSKMKLLAVVAGKVENISNYSISFKYVADLTDREANATIFSDDWDLTPLNASDQYSDKNITVICSITLIFVPYDLSIEVGGETPDLGLIAFAPIDVSISDFGTYKMKFKAIGKNEFKLGIVDATDGISLDSVIKHVITASSSEVAILSYKVSNITNVATYREYKSVTLSDLLPDTLIRPTITDGLYAVLTGETASGQTKTVTVKEQTGAIEIQPSSAFIGETFKVVYSDPDADLDPNTKEGVTIYVEVSGVGNLILTATETGEDTGVFEAKILTTLASSHYISGGKIYLTPEDLYSGVILNARVLDKYLDTGPASESLTPNAKLEEVFKPLYNRGSISSAPTTMTVEASVMPDEVAEITIETKNLNVLKDDIDYIRLMSAGSGKWNVVWCDKVVVGKLELERITSAGTSPYTPNFVNTYVPETNETSGKFVIKFIASGVNAGDKIRVKYYDEFHQSYVAIKEIGVGGVKGEVYFDRNVVYVPAYTNGYTASGDVASKGGTEVYLIVTVHDPDWNKIPGSIETIPDTETEIIVYNGTGDVIGSDTFALTETGTNTGNFTATIKVVYLPSNDYLYVWVGNNLIGGDEVKAMLGGQIRVIYHDPFGDVMKYVVIQPVSDELSLSATSVALNEKFNITFRAPELDQVVGYSDTLQSDLRFKVKVVMADGRVYSDTVTAGDAGFTEVEDGVFVWSTTPADMVDKWLQSITGSNKPSDYAGATITITYIDPIGATSTLRGIVKYETSVTFKIESHTANVTVLPEKVGPYTWLKLTIEDPDLVGLTPDDIMNMLVVSSSETPSDDARTALEKLKIYNEFVISYNITEGKYVFKIKLTLYDPVTYSHDINEGYILVDPHDNVTIIFKDPVDGAGNANKPIVKVVPVVTETAEVSVPAMVSPDSTFTITMSDIDENLNPDKLDTVIAYIWSDAQPTKTKVTLVETDLNSAVFQQKIVVTSDASKIGTSNTVYAPAGSIIYVEVVDPLNAEATEQDMVFKVGVGVAPVTHPIAVNASEAKLVNVMTGEEITTVPAGGLVAVNIPMTNTMSTKSVTFVAIPVVYKDGVPVALGGISTVDIPAGTTRTVSVSLPVLTEPGTYTVKIFVWNSLTGQTPLTPEPVELTITVTSG